MRPYFTIVILFLAVFNSFAQAISDTSFKVVKWRNIGPFRGGRSNCGYGVTQDPMTYYMGTTGGGLWKTSDMGITWSNISDGFMKTGSVGAIAVAKSDPNVVYVGMGEHAIRGVMTHHGDGVYKSTDAGKTWKKMGLDQSQHISRIRIHPTDPNIVYVAVQGALYSKSKERGLYKSIDGGQTWKNILYVDDKTGISELSMDATNPRILYASTWEHGRLPNMVVSGGPGSGVHKSTDGGETWTKINSGLPSIMGKIAVAVCPSNSDKVYALIEGDSQKEEGGLFMSTNGGTSWDRVTNDHRLLQRAWYYIELFIDPKNENVVYALSATAYKSIDGGKTWEALDGTHGDYHDLWINENNPANMAIADDGGVAITFNGGKTWSSQNNMPTAQFYRVNTDNEFPYNVYGGQQDNTSVKIASRSHGWSIKETDWSPSAGGESAFLAFNPDDPNLVMGGSYLGSIELLNVKGKGGTGVISDPIQYLALEPKRMKYRYNWNAPIIWSKHEPNAFYHGSQKLIKTTDNGKSWIEVSPDLTRNDTTKQGKGGGPLTNEVVGAENYGTLAYVIESPHEKGVLWTGSDDGLVNMTMDGGKNWKNVTPQGLQECLINAIEVSPHDKATAYIATTRYKFNDHTPGIYKTTDYGKTWKKIVNGIANNAFTRVVREDIEVKGLLYAGTELGIYVSLNGGETWSPFQLNLPICPITDLKVHKDDLVAATSGRSFWILDDLGLLRQALNAKNSFALYTPESAYLMSGGSPLDRTSESFTGKADYAGINPANGVVFYYNLPEKLEGKTLTLTITDANGRAINTFSSVKDSTFISYDGGPSEEPTLSTKKGLNRFVWNMRHKSIPGTPSAYYEANFRGHKAIPGTYNYTLSYENNKTTANSKILANPHYTLTPSDYAEYDAFMSDAESKATEMQVMINEMDDKHKHLKTFITKVAKDPKHASLMATTQSLSKELTAWDNTMIQRLSKAYDDVENFENKFAANYFYIFNASDSDMPIVAKGALEQKAIFDKMWIKHKDQANKLSAELKALSQKAFEGGVSMF
jgi:photosystem II stability/assembly factor-like uncharacterized protein